MPSTVGSFDSIGAQAANFRRAFIILARVRQIGGKWGKPGRAEITKPDLEPVQQGTLKTKRVPDKREK